MAEVAPGCVYAGRESERDIYVEYRPTVCVFKQIFISDRISTVLSPKITKFPEVHMLF